MEQMRKGYINTVRAIACLLIILLHTVSSWYGNGDKADSFFVWENYRAVFDFTVVQVLVRWCVPAFFMISGVLLLSPEKEIGREKWIGYIKRILLILIVFGTGFCLMEEIAVHRTLNLRIVSQSVINMICARSWAHMWYLYALLGLYIMLPFIRASLMNLPERMVITGWGIMWIILIIIPTVNAIFGINITSLGLQSINGALFYFVTGYVVSNVEAVKNLKSGHIVTGVIISILAFIAIQLYGFSGRAEYTDPFYLYIGVYSIGIMLIMQRSSLIERIGNSRAVALIADNSLAIYLIHPFFLHISYRLLGIYPDFLPMFAGGEIIWALVAALSLFTGMALKRLPLINRIL